MDERSELIDKLSTTLAGRSLDVSELRNIFYIELDEYEISSRCTDIALCQEDRNEALVKKFLVSKMVKGCTERTIEFYTNTMRFVLSKINKTIDDITSDDIRLYIALRKRKDGVTDTTIDNELRVLRSFYAFSLAEELLTKNPMLKVDNVRKERHKKDALTEEEIEKLRYQASVGSGTRAARKYVERDSFIIELLLSTGVRVSELVGIKLNEIQGNRILVHGKGRKDRYVYMNAKAEFALRRYMPKRKDESSPYLFPGDEDGHIGKGTIEARMRELARLAGVEKANPHKFRRTCATMALRRGMPIEQVSKMLGHEEISTTQIYLDLSERDLEYAHSKYVV